MSTLTLSYILQQILKKPEYTTIKYCKIKLYMQEFNYFILISYYYMWEETHTGMGRTYHLHTERHRWWVTPVR